MVDLLGYVIIVWLELTVGLVIVPILVLFALGRYMKVEFILNLLRTKYIYHYIRSINGRLLKRVVMDKEIKTFGKSKFIPYKGFYYKLKDECFFLTGTSISIAHQFNVSEPLTFSKSNEFLFEDSKDLTAQETESAIEAKVVLDLNKSIYTNKDILLFIAVMVSIVLTGVNLYFNYANGQELANLNNYLVHLLGSSTPTG